MCAPAPIPWLVTLRDEPPTPRGGPVGTTVTPVGTPLPAIRHVSLSCAAPGMGTQSSPSSVRDYTFSPCMNTNQRTIILQAQNILRFSV